MKPHYGILLLLLLLFSACHSPQREARQMVRRAERLFGTDPDSTVSLIDSVLRMHVLFSERERMDMAMLQAEALFGRRDVSRNVSPGFDTSGDVSGNVSTLSPLMDDEFFDDKPFLSTSPELEHAAGYYARKKRYDKAARAALYSGFVQQHYGEKQMAMQSFLDAEGFGKAASDSLTVATAEYWMGKMMYDEGMKQEALVLLKRSNSDFGGRYVD